MFTPSNLKFRIVEVLTLSILEASQVTDPMSQNVRELDNYDLPALMDDLKERGLQEEPWVYPTGEKIVLGEDTKPNDVLVPVKGFRRRAAWGALLKEFPEGYKYKDADGKERIRKFDTMRVRLYPVLDPQTRINLMIDHGQRKGLNRVELQIGFERIFGVQYSEKQAVVMLKGTLIENYPPTRKIEETPEKLLGYYRGVVQTAKRIYELPDVAREACLKKLRGDQQWPTNSEIIELHKIHSDEEKADTTATINKSAPGPKFFAKWNELLKVKAEAAKEGNTRGKSSAMQNRQQTEDARKSARSVLVRRVFDVQLRRVSVDKLPVLDKIALELEKNLTPEMRQLLADMGKSDEDKATEEANAAPGANEGTPDGNVVEESEADPDAPKPEATKPEADEATKPEAESVA